MSAGAFITPLRTGGVQARPVPRSQKHNEKLILLRCWMRVPIVCCSTVVVQLHRAALLCERVPVAGHGQLITPDEWGEEQDSECAVCSGSAAGFSPKQGERAM